MSTTSDHDLDLLHQRADGTVDLVRSQAAKVLQVVHAVATFNPDGARAAVDTTAQALAILDRLLVELRREVDLHGGLAAPLDR